jgi:hypothetical protein
MRRAFMSLVLSVSAAMGCAQPASSGLTAQQSQVSRAQVGPLLLHFINVGATPAREVHVDLIDHKQAFEVIDTTCEIAELAPQQTCEVQIARRPDAEADAEAQVVVWDHSGGLAQTRIHSGGCSGEPCAPSYL